MDIESYLLQVLEANDVPPETPHDPAVEHKPGGRWVPLAMDALLGEHGVGAPRLRRPWVHVDGAMPEDRLYADTPELILDRSLIRHRHETLFADDEGTVKGFVWAPMRRQIPGWLVYPGWAPALFVYRTFKGAAEDGYTQQEIVQYNPRSWEVRLCEPRRNSGLRVRRESPATGGELTRQLALELSFVEDNRLPQWWHVRVHAQGAALQIPATPAACRELLKLRDGPNTRSGRRKALVHWVMKHSRRKGDSGETTTVNQHLRGVERVQLDDEIQVVIDPRRDVQGGQ